VTQPPESPSHRRRADLLLLLTTLVWGSTFPAVKASLEFASPFVFVCLRFSVAALLFCGVFPRRVATLSRATLRDGLLLGLLMAGGFITQTIGLGLTSASRSGFLTALYVAFTPLFQLMIGRGLPRAGVIAGGVMVVSGLYLLALPEGEPPTGLLLTLTSGLNAGDLWTLACAALFALYIVAMDVLSPRHDALQLTFVQLLTTAALAGALAPLLETPRLNATFPLAGSILYLGLFASLMAVFIQTRFQRETTPARAAIILAMEAVFAALLAAIFLGDALGLYERIGGGFIVIGLLASELTRGSDSAPDRA